MLIRFGVLSAIGGLVGALLNARVNGPAITIVFAVLLLFAGLSGVTGFAERMRFGGRTAWIAGALSGLFGGMVGNQGGIRSAALLGFELSKKSFVATATAIALVVDGAAYAGLPGDGAFRTRRSGYSGDRSARSFLCLAFTCS